MCLEFDNQQGGQHHKVQIIGAHLLNSAHQEIQDTKRLLSWIVQRKAEFNAENDRAPTILIGDLNAAESSYLDTDREGVEHDSVLVEPDSIVIETIKSMRYEDLIRTRFPDKRVVKPRCGRYYSRHPEGTREVQTGRCDGNIPSAGGLTHMGRDAGLPDREC